jgi:hypothetical protein
LKLRWFALCTLAAGLALLVVQPARLAAQEWKTYSYPADSFSVSFPAEPDQSSKELDTANGKLEVRSYATQDGQTALVVGVFEYKKGLAGRDQTAVLEAGKQGVLTSVKARLGAEKPIALGANPGIEFTAESDAALLTVRMYLVNNFVYQVMVVTPGKTPYGGTQQFLDSFRLENVAGK